MAKPGRRRGSEDVDLAVFADDPSGRVHQDGGVEPSLAAAGVVQLAIPQVEADAEPGCFIEEGLGLRAGHLGFEEGVDLGIVGHVPAREEGGEGHLREGDYGTARRLRLAQQRDQPGHDHGAAFVAPDWAKLRCAERQVMWHQPAAAMTMISTRWPSVARCASTVARTGMFARSSHLSHSAFI